MDPPPNFHPHMGIASSDVLITFTTTASAFGDSPMGYFGLEKPAVMEEECLAEFKWANSKQWVLGAWIWVRRI